MPLDVPFQPAAVMCAAVRISGAVQGVGFRPFVYRLCREYQLRGWVRNTSFGVEMEVEGPGRNVQQFLKVLPETCPSAAKIYALEYSWVAVRGFPVFEILESSPTGPASAAVLPDLAVCSACLSDVRNPGGRRYLYPFTNCTLCGPRYSITTALPYDRRHTTMRDFEMCDDCRREYDNPADRRFHAQPNACPVCGPRVELLDSGGKRMAAGHPAMEAAAEAIARGQIAAVKGLGGFHLMADPYQASAVDLLRRRKHRRCKPFAVMFPDLESVRREALMSTLEERLLSGSGAPIVLLEKHPDGRMVDQVAPGRPDLGVMLAYTPLHHVLLQLTRGPVIATSGNLSDEPICIDNDEALRRLSGIADVFLVHDRGIVRQADDSVLRVIAGRPVFLRRSRGFAPLYCPAEGMGPGLLAVGAHQKSTVALSVPGGFVVSQHIGDLDAPESREAFEKTAAGLESLYGQKAVEAVRDVHPDYASSVWAGGLNIPSTDVQHHHAHAAACMLDNGLEGEVLAVVWDGTGLGDDGTIWGGEFLIAGAGAYRRAGHLRPFALAGGESAARRPWRSALGILYQLFGGSWDECSHLSPVMQTSGEDLKILGRMIASGVNAPVTSSAGRLFDAAASIIGLRQNVEDEGEAAMALECVIGNHCSGIAYPYDMIASADGSFVADWRPMMRALAADCENGVEAGVISEKFHNTLVEMMVDAARRVCLPRVVLTGGCFQNRYLCERAILRLKEEGFEPFWHKDLPPNDGGVAAGQMVVAAARKEKKCV